MNREITAKNQSKAAFDRQAGTYDSTYYGQHARKLYGNIIGKLNEYAYENILDVGCGTGSILKEIISTKKVNAAGVDLSEKMLAVAREHLGTAVDLRNGDSEHLPWEGEQFHMVLCSDSFHHYPNPEAVLREMKRVLRPGGKIILADPWLPSPIRQIMNVFMPFNKDGDVRMYSGKEIKKMLAACGLKFISWERAGRSAFISVSEK